MSEPPTARVPTAVPTLWAARPEVVAVGADDTRHIACWDFVNPRPAISSAPVGGGLATIDWVLNVGVTAGYARTDLEAHARDMAARLGMTGVGATMFTAVDVRRVVRGEDEGVVVDVTVGVTRPTWAASADGAHGHRVDGGWIPGTINVVVQLPVGLSPSAAVNAVMTVTEAKAQALAEAGVPGTGTASDAVLVCWSPAGRVHDFAGPRSDWGARVARATHAAVAAGLEIHP